ncbi:chondroitinase-B domain-containing protein [Thalassotalea crassostreae]|uniref:chondroitinase-B domain-containing protein n=1 Tax=Thalassotalea crassostreae TaxID=1763536 RepID=UPI00083869D8|nr:chondroitinase-B domain-containing protein [Thalassotalea crassostreae]
MVNRKRLLQKSFSIIAISLISFASNAAEFLVKTPDAFKSTVNNLKPGDTIKLANGTWTDFEILFTGKGTKEQPITLTAETKGKVILSGLSNLRMAGKYLVVSGLVFKNGYTPSSEVIAFRKNKTEYAYHSRVTETVIEDYSNPDKQESDYWVGIYGQYNRFDQNYLAGKRNKGVTVAVRLNSKDSQENHHKIDHNYFGPRPIFGSNGGETLRIGTSHHSLTDSFTLVENNYFDRCNGEVEIISVKSGKNHLRNNVFFESRGTLTMRHGNGNIIEGNVFFGNGIDHTGGIRVINKDQIIRNNYMEGLTGYRFGSGFTVMNGVPNSPINRYHQVENALIENNSIINVEHIQLAAGSDAERSAVPIDSKFQHNLVFNENQKQPFTLFDDVSGIAFSGNISNTKVLAEIDAGFKVESIKLERAENGLLYPVGKSIGVDKSLTPIKKSQTGPSWYDKVVGETEFASGEVVNVSPGGDALFNAVNSANDGDVIVLADGDYDERKVIVIDKTLSIKSENTHKARLSVERGTMFEIADGGSLTLDGVVINGKNSPDSSGNSVVRTKKWGMTANYRLVVKNSVIEDLDINHSFHFFVSGNGAFADDISLHNNKFTNVTGDILRLDRELEDLGIYNAEYVTLTDNSFDGVEGALVKLYRGGSDESTFGPHLNMTNNTVNETGNGKRNKSKSSLYLHGVQVTHVHKNELSNSAPIIVEHTVGEPISKITNNTLSQEISVVELRVSGPHTADLSGNKISKN